MRRMLMPLFLAMQINQLSATEASMNGVWRGKIGPSDVIVCFNGALNGSYYYSRYKIPIQLTEKDQSWVEQGNSGTWTLSALSNGNLDGVWRDPKNQKTLAITLAAPTNQADLQPCASDAYNAVLETFPVLQTGKTEKFEGSEFRKLRIADVETIELLTTGTAVDKVNKKLREVLPKSKADLVDYFERRRQFLGDMGLAVEDETFAQPYYWSADWLMVHFYRWAAGFGARGISLDYRTWNMRTGEEVDPWQWFDMKSKFNHDPAGLPPKLKTYLFKNLKEDPECSDDYYGKGEYQITLEPGGIRFWEHPFGSGCEKDFMVPYEKLAPFLTAKGKSAIATLKKH